MRVICPSREEGIQSYRSGIRKRKSCHTGKSSRMGG